MMTPAAEQNVVWRPTPKQAEFLRCPARECLGGGSLGGGKTDALLMAAASQTPNPHFRALFLRRSFPQLRDAVERSHALFIPIGGVFNRQNSVWRFANGSQIEFGFIDSDEDCFRYYGRSFSFIGWDELTTWPNDSAYIFMMTRLRATTGSELRLEMRATCTPGGPGHAWVKERFKIPDDGSASECVDPVTKYRRVFVPFRISDNIHLRGGEYERQLQALPETRRKALLDGLWNVFEGAVFSEWNPRIHVCDPFAIPVEWDVWRGCDDGYAAPACVLWFAKDEIHDRIFVVEELYRSGMGPQVMAEEVLRIDKAIPRSTRRSCMSEPEVFENGTTLSGVIDSASFADTGFGGRADQMNRDGCNWTPCAKDANSRLAGKALIHSRLAMKPDDKPGLIVFKTCRNLIRTLPALCYSRTRPEDVDTDAEDHCYDALRYGLSRYVGKVTRKRVF